MEFHLLADESRRLFVESFGDPPSAVAVAPGRVNLIGEHTDYNDGFVFPMAIDRGVAVAASTTQGPSRAISAFEGETTFDSQSLPGEVEDWGKYVAGVAYAMRKLGYGDPPNLIATVYSDLPIGAGVSSSAALEVAFAAAWSDLMGLELDPVQLATIGRLAENEFVGMQCGIMDQLASAAASEGTAMFIDIRTLEIRYAKAPEDLQIVLCDTGVRHNHVDSKYNERRLECELAAKQLGLASLRDATLENLLEKQSEMDPIAFRRARHVVTENTRCQSFFWALEDRNDLRIGLLMRASHESLREDFEASCPELDSMAEACWSAPGCVGARMTGGGFGGACIALVRQGQVETFRRSAANRFATLSGRQGAFLNCKPAEGVLIQGHS